MLAAGLLLALLGMSRPAAAQSARASFFLQMLRTSTDARLRVSAALRLSELHEPASVDALIQVYGSERDPTVLAAILSAFATIGDPRAMPTVQTATRHASPVVRAQATRALATLQSASSSSGSSTGSSPPPSNNSATARLLIGMGSVNNQSGVRGSQLSQVAQAALQSALARNPAVVVHTGTPAAATARMRGSRLRGHYIDANIQSVQPRGNGVRVAVSIAVSSYPSRVYEFESQTAITISGSSGNTPQTQDDAVRRAIESAANRAIDQLLQNP